MLFRSVHMPKRNKNPSDLIYQIQRTFYSQSRPILFFTLSFPIFYNSRSYSAKSSCCLWQHRHLGTMNYKMRNSNIFYTLSNCIIAQEGIRHNKIISDLRKYYKIPFPMTSIKAHYLFIDRKAYICIIYL